MSLVIEPSTTASSREPQKCYVCKGQGTHRHYPLAIADNVKRRVAWARQQSPEVCAQTLRRIDAMLKYPIYNYRPLPSARAFHQSNKKFRWCIGGNRSSKSHSVAQEVVWWATGTHPWKKITVPNTGWYCTLTWELVGSILWKKVKSLLSHLVEGTDYSVVWHNRSRDIPEIIKIRTVPGTTGFDSTTCSYIIFKAYEQGADSFQGTDRQYIADDEQFPHAIYLEQISRVGPGDPLNFMAAMTPIKAQPWLEEPLTTGVPDAWDVFEYPLDDNRISCGGFIPDETIDGLIAEWPEEVRPTRRYGKWASFMGAVYKTLRRDVHVVSPKNEHLLFTRIKDGRPMVPLQYPTICAVDFGGNNPFVCTFVVYIEHLDAWYVYDEYYWDYHKRGERLLRRHAAAILEKAKGWDTAISRTWADHDRQDRMELESAGVPTMPARKDVMPGIELIQALLTCRPERKHPFNPGVGCPRLFFAERCVNGLKEMFTLSWPDSSETRDPKDEPINKDDHFPDTVRYAFLTELLNRRHGPRITLTGFTNIIR